MRTIEKVWAARYTGNFAHDVERGYSSIFWCNRPEPTPLEAWLTDLVYFFGVREGKLFERVEAAVEAQKEGEITEEEVKELIDELEYRFYPYFAASVPGGWKIAQPGLSAFVGESAEEAFETMREAWKFMDEEDVYFFPAEVVGKDEDHDSYRDVARVSPLPGPVYQSRDGQLVQVGEIVEEEGRLRYRGE